MHLSQLKDLPIPLIETATGQELNSILGQLKAYFGGRKGEQAITHGLLEVT